MNRRAIQSLAGSVILSISVAFTGPSFWWGGVVFGALVFVSSMIPDPARFDRPEWGSSEKRG